MTDPATLLALAERCEQATGPDKELDFTIDDFMLKHGAETDRIRNPRYVLPYTASLDAAVTLVPEGYYWQAANGKRRHSEPQACADLFVAHGPNRGDMSFTADAATAALALCAAALRARAAMLHPAG
jgi:hypothetical protein